MVAQWQRIRLPIQETWAWSLVWEDSTCCGAAKPMRHHDRIRVPTACVPQENPPQWEAHVLQQRAAPCFPQLEKACAKPRRPSATKNNLKTPHLWSQPASHHSLLPETRGEKRLQPSELTISTWSRFCNYSQILSPWSFMWCLDCIFCFLGNQSFHSSDFSMPISKWV